MSFNTECRRLNSASKGFAYRLIRKNSFRNQKSDKSRNCLNIYIKKGALFWADKRVNALR